MWVLPLDLAPLEFEFLVAVEGKGEKACFLILT